MDWLDAAMDIDQTTVEQGQAPSPRWRFSVYVNPEYRDDCHMNGIWIDQFGREIPVGQMETDHMIRAIEMLESFDRMSFAQLTVKSAMEDELLERRRKR